MKRQPRLAPGAPVNRDLRRSMGLWQGAVLRMPLIDPVTTELVRLRCADYHDCGL